MGHSFLQTTVNSYRLRVHFRKDISIFLRMNSAAAEFF